MGTGQNSLLRMWFMEAVIPVPMFSAAILVLLEDDVSGPITAGVAKLLVNSVYLATDGSVFTNDTLCVIRLEHPGDVDDGRYWDTDSGGSWKDQGSVVAFPVGEHQEAAQHAFLFPAAATTGRDTARITYTFVDSISSATTVCGTKEYLIGDIVDQLLDEVNTGADHNIKDSVGKQIRQGSTGGLDIEAKDVVSATASTITLDGSESAVNDFLNRRYIAIVDGFGIGQVRVVSDYNGTTKIATISRAWDIVPNGTSDYILLLSTEADLAAQDEARLRYVNKWVGGDDTQPVTHTTAVVGAPGATSTPDGEVNQTVTQTNSLTTIVEQAP